MSLDMGLQWSGLFFLFSGSHSRLNIYRPQRSCGQGNIFTPVCHSVHRGVYLVPWGVLSPMGGYLVQGMYLVLGGVLSPRGVSGLGGWSWGRGWGSGPGGCLVWGMSGLGRLPPKKFSLFIYFKFFFFFDFKKKFFFWFLFFNFNFLFFWGSPPPPRSSLRHMVNERPVPILLECILVILNIFVIYVLHGWYAFDWKAFL